MRSALALAPDSAATQHALGLLLVRRKRLDEALTFLARAVELAPEQPRYVYVYAVALHSAGEPARAREVLQQAARRHPDDPTIAAFLAELEAQPGS